MNLKHRQNADWDDEWERALSSLERLIGTGQSPNDAQTLPPNANCIVEARKALCALRVAGAPIFHLCAGPSGEIAIDLKVQNKEAHLLFEPSGATYLLVDGACRRPQSGAFDVGIIPELMQWLKS